MVHSNFISFSKTERLKSYWARVIGEISTLYSGEDIDCWFSYLEPLHISEDNVLFLGTSNSAVYKLFKRNFSFFRRFSEICFNVYGVDDIDLIKSEKRLVEEKERDSDFLERIQLYSSKIPLEKCLDNYVVGEENYTAWNAVKKIINKETLAPLIYFFGPPGVGKTHLIAGLYKEICRKKIAQRVMYISVTKFMSELVRSFRDKNTLKFKEILNSLDILLIDDVQNIRGTNKVEKELCLIIRNLVDFGKKVIISSSCKLTDLFERANHASTVLHSSLTIKIDLPGYDLRFNIIKQKVADYRMKDKKAYIINDDIIAFIAKNFVRNSRELEGVLLKIFLHAEITGKEVNIDNIKGFLGDALYQEEGDTYEVETIQEAVASFYGIKTSDLLVKTRTKKFSYPRQVAIYLCRKKTKASLKEIGSKFGNRSHVLVIYAYNKIEAEVKKDPNCRATIKRVLSRIKRF